MPKFSRREALRSLGGGVGMLGLADLLAGDAFAAGAHTVGPHFAPKAKNVIMLFMTGGPSQVDLWDPKHKGKVGVIVRAMPKEDRIVVEGIAVAKRHTKGRSGQTGRIIERPMPIHVSNLMLVCSKDGPVKVGYRINDNGKKVRVCRKCGAEL